MKSMVDPDKVKQAANQLLSQGDKVTVASVAEILAVDADATIQAALDLWWMELEKLTPFNKATYSGLAGTGIPDTIYSALQNLWQDALKEAKVQLLAAENKPARLSASQRLEQDNEAFIIEAKLRALEESHQMLVEKYKKQEAAYTLIEAEKLDLTISIKQAKTDNKALQDKHLEAKDAIGQLEKAVIAGKQQLERRIKEEDERHLKLIQKQETKLNYFQNELDKSREEWNKREAALTNQIRALQTQQSTDKKKIDSQKRQLANQEQELKIFRKEAHDVVSSKTSSKSQALISKNEIKRLQETIQEKETDIKDLKQRTMMAKSEASRREQELNAILRERDAELNILTEKCKELQLSLIAREEEVKRLRSNI